MNIRLFLTVLFVAAFSMNLKSQQTGWFIIEQQEDRFGNFSSQSVFIQDQQIRIENAESVFLLDLVNDQLTLIFPEQKIFWQGQPDQLREAIVIRLKQQVAEILSRLPEYSRDEADSSFRKDLELFEAGLPPTDSLIPVTKEKKNTVDTILGQPTIQYAFYLDSVLLETIWIAKEINPYAGIDRKALREMTSIFHPPIRVAAHRESTQYQQLIENAVVMRSVIPTPIGESTTEIKQISSIPIPEAFFLPPPDYKKALIEEVISITMDQDAPEPVNTGKREKIRPVNPFEQPQNTFPPH